MKGDFSRIRFEANKHYTDVLDQQGRIAYDADHNEQRLIDGHRRTAQTIDVIGEYGAPMREAGFDISIVDGQLQIGPGRYYVHGLLCENAEALNYDEQPFLLEGTSAEDLQRLLVEVRRNPALCVRVYLEVWQRMVTALDDQCLGEPALGQADTTTRLQTVWRVVAGLVKPQEVFVKNPANEKRLSEDIDKVLMKSAQSKSAAAQRDEDLARLFVREPQAAEQQETECSCESMYRDVPPPHPGLLCARTNDSGNDCGCQPIPAAGYTGQENQLYRIEIQRSGTLASATLKWSRENASIVVAVLSVSGSKVAVNSLGMDANLGFQVGQWVEVSDDTFLFGEHPNRPGLLYQIQSIDRPSLALTMTATVQPVDPTCNARMRRWEQSGPTASAEGIPLSSSWIALENGIEVCFRNGRYFAGDAWTFPARSATGKIDWPPCGSDGSQFQPPHYTHIYRAPLACIHFTSKAAAVGTARFVAAEQSQDLGKLFTVEDCRRLFPSLTDLGDSANANALHITRISWKNDEVMTFDALVRNGLAVSFDQPPTCPLSSANFVVTLEVPVTLGSEKVQMQELATAEVQLQSAATESDVASTSVFAMPSTPTVMRTASILDSTVTRHGRAVTWSLPTSNVSQRQLVDLEAIDTMLKAWARRRLPVRVRVRLSGRVMYAHTDAGKMLYLDGQSLGTNARSQIEGRERIDLCFPSGAGERASDFESWFYLYPAQAVQGVDFTYQRVTVSNENGVPVITDTQPEPTTKPVVQRATITMAYAAINDTVIQLALSGGPGIATVPAQITVKSGQTTASVDVAIRQTPTSANGLTFTLTASLPTALDQATSQTASFLMLGRGGKPTMEDSAASADHAVLTKKAAATAKTQSAKRSAPARKKAAKRASTKRSDS